MPHSQATPMPHSQATPMSHSHPMGVAWEDAIRCCNAPVSCLVANQAFVTYCRVLILSHTWEQASLNTSTGTNSDPCHWTSTCFLLTAQQEVV